MRILLIEGDRGLARSICTGLRSRSSAEVVAAPDGPEGARLALSEPFDVVVLDLHPTGIDGIEVLRRMRAAGVLSPVLFLSASAAREDVLRCFDLGCDDYLARPFDMGELIARVRALVRRGPGQRGPVLRVADLEIDTGSHVVRRGGRSFVLPAQEYRLLVFLALRVDAVVSKDQILEHLCGADGERISNIVERYVCNLRSKIDRPGASRLLHTARGQGYLLGEVEVLGEGL